MSSGSFQTTVGTMTPVEDLMIDAFLTPGGPMSFGSLKTLVIRRRPFQSNNQPWSAQLRSRQKGTSRRYVPHSWRTSAISLFLVKIPFAKSMKPPPRLLRLHWYFVPSGSHALHVSLEVAPDSRAMFLGLMFHISFRKSTVQRSTIRPHTCHLEFIFRFTGFARDP